MALPKRELVATNVMEHPLLHHFNAVPSFHSSSQNSVAGMLHYISHQPTLLSDIAIPTFLNNVFMHSCLWRFIIQDSFYQIMSYLRAGEYYVDVSSSSPMQADTAF